TFPQRAKKRPSRANFVAGAFFLRETLCPSRFRALDSGIQWQPMSKTAKGRGHDTRYVQLQKNYCFGCGTNNPDGMKLKFVYDEESNAFVSRSRLGKR